MLERNQSLWHNFKSVIGRLGTWFHQHFKHITGAVRFVADKIHSWNMGPASSIAGLVSRGTHIADAIFDYGHAIYGWDPPNVPNPFTGEPSSGVPPVS